MATGIHKCPVCGAGSSKSDIGNDKGRILSTARVSLLETSTALKRRLKARAIARQNEAKK